MNSDAEAPPSRQTTDLLFDPVIGDIRKQILHDDPMYIPTMSSETNEMILKLPSKNPGQRLTAVELRELLEHRTQREDVA